MYICTTNAEFLGVPPTCELQLCSSVGLPETVGVDTLACVEGIQSGQSCEVGCSYGFEGDSSTYRCVQGVFEGAPPTCQRKACEAPREEIMTSPVVPRLGFSLGELSHEVLQAGPGSTRSSLTV